MLQVLEMEEAALEKHLEYRDRRAGYKKVKYDVRLLFTRSCIRRLFIALSMHHTVKGRLWRLIERPCIEHVAQLK